MDFIISDLHINHANIIQHCNRPFKNVTEMNEALISNWNNIVGLDDTTYVVGDFFMGEKALWPSHRAKLNGKITLVMGNHDTKGKKFTHAEDIAWMKECGIETVVDEYYYEDQQHNIVYWLNHFPPAGFDRYTDERGYQRPPAKRPYDVMIHGHTHSKEIYTKHNVLHVGADSLNFTPISFDTLYEIWCKQPTVNEH